MLAKFNIEKIPVKILISGYSDIRYIDLFNRTCEYFFRSPDNQTKIDNRLKLLHWGLTWDHDFIYAIHTPLEIYDNNQFIPVGFIGKFSFNGQLINYVPIKEKLVQPHQLQYYNNYLWLADTGSNTLKKINIKSGEFDTITPEPLFTIGDTHHFNSIWLHKNEIYTTSHNIACPKSRLPNAGVYILDADTYENIHEWEQGSHIHNVFKLNNKICVCNSDSGIIFSQDGSIQLHVGAYTRGVSIIDEYILVGQSPVEIRDRRGGGYICNINVFDKNKMGKIGDIQLFSMGQIMEIRCTNQKDYAHNEIIIH